MGIILSFFSRDQKESKASGDSISSDIFPILPYLPSIDFASHAMLGPLWERNPYTKTKPAQLRPTSVCALAARTVAGSGQIRVVRQRVGRMPSFAREQASVTRFHSQQIVVECQNTREPVGRHAYWAQQKSSNSVAIRSKECHGHKWIQALLAQAFGD